MSDQNNIEVSGFVSAATAGHKSELRFPEIERAAAKAFSSERDLYVTITNRGSSNGGIREPSPPDAPPHWLVYFGAEDIDAALARVVELGGTKLAGPIDIGIAKIGVVQDPQGATFALYAGQFES